jgi:CRP-like cAMP-binding protein
MAHLHLAHSGAGPIPRNRLLAALAPEDLAQLSPRLEPVEFSIRHVIQVPEEPITAVYFPETGWISMVALLADGGAAEVGLIGREGMVGLPLALGATLLHGSPVWACRFLPVFRIT